jgi:hypothetical protein
MYVLCETSASYILRGGFFQKRGKELSHVFPNFVAISSCCMIGIVPEIIPCSYIAKARALRRDASSIGYREAMS